MRRALPLIGLWWVVNLGCKSTECEGDLDCPSGMECSSAGSCEPITGGCPSPPCVIRPDTGVKPDTGVDTGVPDVGDTGTGGGDGGDAGTGGDDGGDGGQDDGGDGGLGGDGGNNDAGGNFLYPFGEVWVAEYNTGQGSTAFTTYAEFRDRSGAMFDIFTMEYQVQNAGCFVDHETYLSGPVIGYGADRVDVDLNNGQQLTYLPVGGMAGLYQPSAVPSAGLFTGSTGVDFEIVSDNLNGSLDDATASAGVPTPIGLIMPMLGLSQTLSQGVTLSWLATDPIPGKRTVVELHDATRRTRMVCRLTNDTGTFTLPSAAVTDFLAQTWTAPLELELRYEYVIGGQVAVVGSADMVTVLYHSALGVRWPATP